MHPADADNEATSQHMRFPAFLTRHREFLGHVATMMSGKTIAAAIALFTTPIVARLFSPDDFGVAASFMAMVSVISSVSSLRYEMALSLPEQEEEAVRIMSLCYWILFAGCALLLLLVAIHEFSGLELGMLEILGVWSWLLPFGVLLVSAVQIQEGWLTRHRQFRILSGSLVLGNTVTSGSRIGFGALFGTSTWGLITGILLGNLSRLLVQRAASAEGMRATFAGPDREDLKKVAKAYRDFPRLNAPAGFIFMLGGNLPVLLFGMMFSPTAAGLYAMANRLVQVPTTIIAASMRRVFLQKAASIRNRGRSVRKAYLLTTGSLAVIGTPPLIILSLYGQPMLGWLLGDRWVEAGAYLEAIAPWMFMIWVTAASNPVFVVLRKQKFWLFLQTSLTVFRLAAFGLAHVLGATPLATLRLFVMATVLGNIATIFCALWVISMTPGRASNAERGTGAMDHDAS